MEKFKLNNELIGKRVGFELNGSETGTVESCTGTVYAVFYEPNSLPELCRIFVVVLEDDTRWFYEKSITHCWVIDKEDDDSDDEDNDEETPLKVGWDGVGESNKN